MTSIRHRPGAATRRWELWTLNRSLLAYALTVESVTLGTTVLLIGHAHVGARDLLMLAAIVGFGLAKEELTRHVERIRRRFSDTPHQNMTSVWTFAAAVFLPPGLAVGVVAVLYAYLWLRIWRPLHGERVWKVVFNASTATLSCHAATITMHAVNAYPLIGWREVGLATVAILIYSAVNLGLAAGALALMTTERTVRRLFGTLADAALEYATLTIGAVAAILLVHAPAAVLLLIPTLVVLHQNVLLRQLEEAASIDAKTGLLNATTWRSMALTELDRAKREGTTLGILLLDLDHFKSINDGKGHLVGDQVLAAIAEQLKQGTRQYDVLGRFGGDEFVLLCPGVDVTALIAIAERTRTSVEQLPIPDVDLDAPVTVSIGAALYPEVGPALEDLLLAADNALFAAKDADRNRVVIRYPQAPIQRQDWSGDSSN